jgi:hypothetical protein
MSSQLIVPRKFAVALFIGVVLLLGILNAGVGIIFAGDTPAQQSYVAWQEGTATPTINPERIIRIDGNRVNIVVEVPPEFTAHYFLETIVMTHEAQSIRFTIGSVDDIAQVNMGLSTVDFTQANFSLDDLLADFIDEKRADYDSISEINSGEIDAFYIDLTYEGITTRLYLKPLENEQVLFIEANAPTAEFSGLAEIMMGMVEPIPLWVGWLPAEKMETITNSEIQLTVMVPEGFEAQNLLEFIFLRQGNQKIRFTINTADTIAHDNLGLELETLPSNEIAWALLLNYIEAVTPRYDDIKLFSPFDNGNRAYVDLTKDDTKTRIYLQALEDGRVLYAEASAPADEFDAVASTLMSMIDGATIEE